MAAVSKWVQEIEKYMIRPPTAQAESSSSAAAAQPAGTNDTNGGDVSMQTEQPTSRRQSQANIAQTTGVSTRASSAALNNAAAKARQSSWNPKQ